MVTEEIERLAVERASAEDIAQVAREQGMIDAARRRPGARSLAGMTSIEEILRVVV